MNTDVLSAIDQLATGADLRVKIDFSDFTQATVNTPQTLELFKVQKNERVHLVAILLEQAFEDTRDAAFNSTSITLGDGVSASRFLASTQINKNGASVSSSVGSGTPFAYTAEDTVDAVITPMAAKALNSLNKGKLTMLFKRVKLPKFLG